MPSVIQADLLKDATSTKTLATLSSSAVTLHSDVSFPAGHVIQTTFNSYSTQTSITGSGGTYTSTGLVGTITPTSTSNKLLITVGLQMMIGNGYGSFSLRLNASDGGVVYTDNNTNAHYWSTGTTVNFRGRIFTQAWITPASSGSAITYTVELSKDASSITLNAQQQSVPSSITIQEIQQ